MVFTCSVVPVRRLTMFLIALLWAIVALSSALVNADATSSSSPSSTSSAPASTLTISVGAVCTTELHEFEESAKADVVIARTSVHSQSTDCKRWGCYTVSILSSESLCGTI